MKKISLAFLVLGTVTVGGVFSSTLVQADTLAGDTTTSVKVNPGPLDMKPDQTIAFEDVTITGKEQSINEKTESKVDISDLRGSIDTGWTLKVKKIDGETDGFGNKANRGIDVSLTPTSAGYVTAAESFIVNDKEQLVASISKENIQQTEIETSIALGAKLNISEKAFAQTYKTTLSWNLTAGPEAGK
ncbi:TPA: hypothetical protein P0372_000628 [Listeria innocua]|nr:hypothetical protein [Listeria innocua]EED2042422.1 hypothetical protein [Listeria innocua]EKJ8907056.1 hypothetical protein [Listeria innocua]EKJ8909827.1 hypothetical protein [Listeria innocua]EKJ8914407.1 hypothetical protein [Listeria innocua]